MLGFKGSAMYVDLESNCYKYRRIAAGRLRLSVSSALISFRKSAHICAFKNLYIPLHYLHIENNPLVCCN